MEDDDDVLIVQEDDQEPCPFKTDADREHFNRLVFSDLKNRVFSDLKAIDFSSRVQSAIYERDTQILRCSLLPGHDGQDGYNRCRSITADLFYTGCPSRVGKITAYMLSVTIFYKPWRDTIIFVSVLHDEHDLTVEFRRAVISFVTWLLDTIPAINEQLPNERKYLKVVVPQFVLHEAGHKLPNVKQIEGNSILLLS
jgi:hypothetical protein